MERSLESFIEKLDQEHDWPSVYMFKFVVPVAKESEFRALFPTFPFESKHSKTGKYISFTMKKEMHSSDEIVAIYLEAKNIEGLISL